MNAALRESWKRMRDTWPEEAITMFRRGLAQHRSAVLANPAAYRDEVNRFLQAITASHARLQKLKPYAEAGKLDKRRYDALVRQYEVLGAGLFSGAYQADQPSIAGPHVLLVIGGIGFIAAAIIWAVVAWQQARVLDHQTQVMETELEARIVMNAQGRQLQPSTLEFPDQPPIVDASGSGSGLLIAGGVATGLAAVAALAYAAWKSKN